jgi:hypothetical protein
MGCPYQCYNCNSTSCTSCNTNLTNRYLSGNSCIPLDGYFDNGVDQIAELCQSPCENCQNSSTNCTLCVSYYYLDSNGTCSNCPANCIACSSGSICTICDANYIINSTTLLCELNCSVNSPYCLDCYESTTLSTPLPAARLLVVPGANNSTVLCTLCD